MVGIGSCVLELVEVVIDDDLNFEELLSDLIEIARMIAPILDRDWSVLG